MTKATYKILIIFTCLYSWWRARAAVLSLLQVAVFTNMFTILSDERAPQQVQDLVVGLLSDSRLEVQQMASTVLSGLVHCKFIQAEDKLLVRNCLCTDNFEELYIHFIGNHLHSNFKKLHLFTVCRHLTPLFLSSHLWSLLNLSST